MWTTILEEDRKSVLSRPPCWNRLRLNMLLLFILSRPKSITSRLVNLMCGSRWTQLRVVSVIEPTTSQTEYVWLLPRPRRGLRGIVFTRSVCLSVCVSVCLCVCPANILVFYFSAIRRDIDLKFMQDIYRVVLNTQKNIDLHRSKVKVTGTVHCFLKVQSYHKNWALEFFFFF